MLLRWVHPAPSSLKSCSFIPLMEYSHRLRLGDARGEVRRSSGGGLIYLTCVNALLSPNVIYFKQHSGFQCEAGVACQRRICTCRILLKWKTVASELCDLFWWNSFDSAVAVFRSLKGKAVKANALSINSISSWISHLMESKMAQDLFAILTQWIWKGFHRPCQAYWVQNGF